MRHIKTVSLIHILFTIALLLTWGNAHAEDYYLSGAFNQWRLKDPTCKFTEAENGEYILELDCELPSEFKINDGTWSNANANWGGSDVLVPGELYHLDLGGTSGNIKLNETIKKPHIVFNPSENTLLIIAAENEYDTVYLVGDFGHGWDESITDYPLFLKEGTDNEYTGAYTMTGRQDLGGTTYFKMRAGDVVYGTGISEDVPIEIDGTYTAYMDSGSAFTLSPGNYEFVFTVDTNARTGILKVTAVDDKPVAKSIADLYRIAETISGGEILVDFPLTVTAVGFSAAWSTYVTDGKDYTLLFDLPTEYQYLDIIPGGWTAVYAPYQTLPEFKAVGDMPESSGKGEFTPREVSLSDISAEIVNEVVVIKNVQFVTASFGYSESTDIDGLRFYNKFGTEYPGPGTYDVRAAISRYKDLIEVFPLEYIEYRPVAKSIADMYRAVETSSRGELIVDFPLTVTAVAFGAEWSTYVTDGKDYALLYDLPTEYQYLDIIPGGWTAVYNPFQTLPEFRVNGDMPEASGKGEFTPREVSVSDISAEMLNEVVVIKNVQFVAGSLDYHESTDIDGLRFYNKFGTEYPGSGNYDVRAAIAMYKDVIEAFPIEYLPVSTTLQPGDDFEYNGLWYTVLDAEAHTCETRRGTVQYDAESDRDIPLTSGNEARGTIVIPSRVPFGDAEYTVVGIGKCGFAFQPLTDVGLPYSLTSIGDFAFNQSGLTYVEVPPVNTLGQYAFAACQALENVTLHGNPANIGDWAFGHCPNLTNVEFDAHLTTLGFGMFEGCSSLEIVPLPESLTTIGAQAFRNCTGLLEMSANEALTTIGNHAFDGCTTMYAASLPYSLTTLGQSAFAGCDALMRVEYPAETPIEAAANCFGETTYAEATLQMSAARMADIEATVPWSLFQHVKAKDGEKPEVIIPRPVIRLQEAEPESGSELDCLKSGSIVTFWNTEGTDYMYNETTPIRVLNAEDEVMATAYLEFDFDDPFMWTIRFYDSSIEIITQGEYRIVIPDNVFEYDDETFGEGTTLYYTVNGSLDIPVVKDPYTFSHAVPADGSTVTYEQLKHIATYWNVDDDAPSVDFNKTPVLLDADGAELAKGVMEFDWDDVSLYTIDFNYDAYDGDYTVVIPEGILLDDQDNPNSPEVRLHYTVEGNPVFTIQVGDDFEYEGLRYTVTSIEPMTCETHRGTAWMAGNTVTGDLTIPAVAINDGYEFAVTRLGEYAFTASDDLLSVTLPASVTEIGEEALAGCPRLTSLVWRAPQRLSDDIVASIDNPNLLVYVDDARYAPESMTHNVVTLAGGSWSCAELLLTPAHPFRAAVPFRSLRSTLTKVFTQTTPVDGCGGWETIVLPFEAMSVRTSDSRTLTPFAAVTDIWREYPYWLLEADGAGEWKPATAIKAGVPYIISMPNNAEYETRYNVSGPVTFSTTRTVEITPETTAPYAVTWATGREFRSLWLPLAEDETAGALGLNVGIEDLTDDEGRTLWPGSAFHYGVTPQPLEAYVTRLGAERAVRITRGESGILTATAESGLRVENVGDALVIHSATDRRVDVYHPDGVHVATCDVRAGIPCRLEGLAKGIYLAAGRKLTVR